LPKARPRKRVYDPERIVRRLLALGAAVVVLYLFGYNEVRAPLRPPIAPALTLAVAPGATTDSIGRQLRELNVVRHPLVFRLWVRFRRAEGKLKAGEYAIDGPMSLEQIVDMLVRGDTLRRDVTFPEGRSIEDMAALAAAHGLDEEAFLAAARDASSIRDLDPLATDLEGYVFPDTYDIPRAPDAARMIVLRAVQRFREVIAPELPRLAGRNLTLRQLVTLASIVELETGRADERPRIASVFLNRLAKGIPLQTDPTIIFALKSAGRWNGNIRKKDLEIDSPYNTYARQGLPPGPIASPGRESLLAVLSPAATKDLYFVSRNDGSHEFSETLTAHERAVDVYQRSRSRDRAEAR
jgi:UPF0755 protein